jgi:hypothetical protein
MLKAAAVPDFKVVFRHVLIEKYKQAICPCVLSVSHQRSVPLRACSVLVFKLTTASLTSLVPGREHCLKLFLTVNCSSGLSSHLRQNTQLLRLDSQFRSRLSQNTAQLLLFDGQLLIWPKLAPQRELLLFGQLFLRLHIVSHKEHKTSPFFFLDCQLLLWP